MRITREELLNMYPGWNEERHDIIKAFYGDIPLIHYDEGEYHKYQEFAQNCPDVGAIGGVEAYIYNRNGTYDIYRTLIGEVKIHEDGRVLCGNLTFKVGKSKYTVYINRMYGMNGLSIYKHHFDVGCIGFVNNDGGMATSVKIKELDKDTIEKILHQTLKDYGASIQKFMDTARKIYDADTTNHILERPFILHKVKEE